MTIEEIREWWHGKNLPPIDGRPTMEEVVDFLLSELDRAREEYKKLDAAFDALLIQVGELSCKLQAAESRIEELESQIQASRQSLKEHMQLLKERESRIQKLEWEITELWKGELITASSAACMLDMSTKEFRDKMNEEESRISSARTEAMRETAEQCAQMVVEWPYTCKVLAQRIRARFGLQEG